MSRILVVEDHALVREGLVAALSRLDDVREVIEAADAESAMEIVGREDDLDCILLDLMLPGARGYACLNGLRSLRPEVPVVVVSGRDDRETVTNCLRLGASGFVPKAFNGEQLLEALRVVLSGAVYAPGVTDADEFSNGQGAGSHANSNLRSLTGAQARVLGLLAQGRSNREISAHLGLAEGTVKIHLTAIYKTLGVANRAQALLLLADPRKAQELRRLRSVAISGARRPSTPAPDPETPNGDR